MKTTGVLTLLAALALLLAAPAAADSAAPGYTALAPELVPGAGLHGVAGATHTIVRLATGRGLVVGGAFTIGNRHVTFTSGRLHFTSLTGVRTLFGPNAVKLRGVGLLDGRRVFFTAVGVHNALPEVDVFRIAWDHGATHGGVVTSGAVFIR